MAKYRVRLFLKYLIVLIIFYLLIVSNDRKKNNANYFINIVKKVLKPPTKQIYLCENKSMIMSYLGVQY